MLSLVTAAEQQYRFDTASRAREDAVLRAIRDRDEAAAAETARAHVTRRAAPSSRPRPANAQRAAAVCASA